MISATLGVALALRGQLTDEYKAEMRKDYTVWRHAIRLADDVSVVLGFCKINNLPNVKKRSRGVFKN